MCVQYLAGQVFCFHRYLIGRLRIQAGFVVVDEDGEVYPAFFSFAEKPVFMRMSANHQIDAGIVKQRHKLPGYFTRAMPS